MATRKKRRVYPILGGLLALLVLAAIFYVQSFFKTATLNQDSLADIPENASEKVHEKSHLHHERSVIKGQLQNEPTTAVKGLIPFKLDYSTKDSFDRFIFMRTTEEPHGVKLAYSTHASAVFTPGTQAVATDLFVRYVDYKVALSSIEVEVDLASHSLQDVSYKLDEREGIRRTYFNDTEYHYLFSQEAQVDEAALARLQLAQESTLTREERKALIVESLETGNQAERDVFQPTLNMHRINEIKRSYKNVNDRYNAVAAEFGSEIADRFAKTWEKQAHWESKIADYEKYRDKLSKQAIAASELESALREYQSVHFTDNEIKRLKVITGS